MNTRSDALQKFCNSQESFCRFGVGKKGMEKICIEEMLHLNEEIQKQNGKPFDIEVNS